MIVQKEFLGKLKDLGVNSYEAKLWTALLSRGVATAGELSDIAGVPRSRSYDVLESLERKGFIVMKLGKPIKYIAVAPGEVIERVKKKVKEEAERQDKVLTGMKDSDVIEQLNTLHESGNVNVNPTEITGVVKGKTNVISHMNFLLKNAKKTAQIMLSTPRAGLLNDLKRGLNKAAKNKIKVNIISPRNTETTNKNTNHKAHKQANMSFLMTDNKEILFLPVNNSIDHQQDFGIWVNNEQFSKNFSHLFDHTWKK